MIDFESNRIDCELHTNQYRNNSLFDIMIIEDHAEYFDDEDNNKEKATNIRNEFKKKNKKKYDDDEQNNKL